MTRMPTTAPSQPLMSTVVTPPEPLRQKIPPGRAILRDSSTETTRPEYLSQTSMSVLSSREDIPRPALRETPSTSSSPVIMSVPEGTATGPTPYRPADPPIPTQTSLQTKRKSCLEVEQQRVTKRLKMVNEEDLPVVPIQRTASSPEDIPRVTTPPKGLQRSMTYPRGTPQLHSRRKYPGPYLRNYLRIIMRTKVPPGSFKLRRRTSTDPRPSEISLRVPSDDGKEVDLIGGTRDVKEVSAGERIVDFLCFSHDVTLYKLFLSFDGRLEIQDQGCRSLRTVTSATGEFVLREPLVLEARKSYRIYFDSRFESVAPYRGTTWEIRVGDLTLEWGHCAIVGGMQLLVSS